MCDYYGVFFYFIAMNVYTERIELNIIYDDHHYYYYELFLFFSVHSPFVY